MSSTPPIFDKGATNTLLPLRDAHLIENLQPSNLALSLPNGDHIISVGKGTWHINSEVNVPAELIDINRGLISTADIVNQSSDQWAEVSIQTGTTVYRNGAPVLISPKETTDRLFPLNLTPTETALDAHRLAMNTFHAQCQQHQQQRASLAAIDGGGHGVISGMDYDPPVVTSPPTYNHTSLSLPTLPSSLSCNTPAVYSSEGYPSMCSQAAQLTPVSDLSASANLVWSHDSLAEKAAFFGRALGCPPLSAMLRALRNDWITNCPLVTPSMLRKHYENPIATAFGHLELQRQHHSTARQSQPTVQPRPVSTPAGTDDSDLEDMLHDLSIHHDLTHTMLVTYVEVKKSTMSADPVGDYPIISSQGHTGFLVASLNGVAHIELMTGHSGVTHLAAVTSALLFFNDQKKNVRRIMTDAETSATVQQHYREQNVELQLANSDMHRQLFAELQIKFGKRQFISTRASIDTRFPDNEWHRLVEHVELCLQVLHPCTDEHTKSGFMWLYGRAFDWDRYPLAPPATMVVAFTSREHRDSWDDHGWVGWYLGPDLLHYRGFRVWNPTTNAYSTVGTVAWFPQHVKMPGFYTHQRILALLSDVVTELRRTPLTTPGDTAKVQQLSLALENLQDMYTAPDLQPDVPSVHPSFPQAIADAQTAYDTLQRIRPAGVDYNEFHPLKAPRAPRTEAEIKQEKQARALAVKAAKAARKADALQHLRLEVQL